MHRIGQTPEWGIPQAENGLFVSDISYTPESQNYEQKNEMGEICGLVMYGEKVTVEISGEVPFAGSGGAASTGMTLGAAITLNNSCPADCWLGGTAPEATTSVLTGAPYTLSREGARTRSYSGAIYPFDSSAESA